MYDFDVNFAHFKEKDALIDKLKWMNFPGKQLVSACFKRQLHLGYIHKDTCKQCILVARMYESCTHNMAKTKQNCVHNRQAINLHRLLQGKTTLLVV